MDTYKYDDQSIIGGYRARSRHSHTPSVSSVHSSAPPSLSSLSSLLSSVAHVALVSTALSQDEQMTSVLGSVSSAVKVLRDRRKHQRERCVEPGGLVVACLRDSLWSREEKKRSLIARSLQKSPGYCLLTVFLLVMGAAMAVLSVLIDLAIEYLQHGRFLVYELAHTASLELGLFAWIALMIVAALIAVIIVHFGSPIAAGSGIPQVLLISSHLISSPLLGLSSCSCSRSLSFADEDGYGWHPLVRAAVAAYPGNQGVWHHLSHELRCGLMHVILLMAVTVTRCS